MTEKGFSLIELTISIFMIAVLSMSVLKNTTSALRAAKLTEVHHAATSLVISRIEELAAIETIDITAGHNESGTAVTWQDLNLGFSRDTVVAINADGSRDVTVTVTCDSELFNDISVDFSTTFAPWE